MKNNKAQMTVYVSFDSGNNADLNYFQMMQTKKLSDNAEILLTTGQNFRNYYLHKFTDSLEILEEIKTALKERIKKADVFVVLIGETTRYLKEIVHWEIEIALELEKPIIAINLNQNRLVDTDRCPSILEDKLALHICFNLLVLKSALEGWPTYSISAREKGKITPHYLSKEYYARLGL